MKDGHDSASNHVRGKSEFIDDRPFVRGELHVGLVTSPYARARIRAVDVSQALKVTGVAGVFLARDFPHNRWGTIFADQPLLAEKEVNFYGESVAVVAAEDAESLRRGIAAVRVDYTPETPILTIEDAVAKGSFIGSGRAIERGDVTVALAASPRRLSGTIVIRGQDHFYLESQCCVAYPREDGQVEIHSSSQHPTEVQHVVAHGLGLASKDVVCIVKRMGGAFGGKESQAAPYAAYAALVAMRLGRPARLVLTKDEDMICTGKRNPFQNRYEVGFDDEGRLLALDVELFSDGGAYADLSTAIMERAMLHCDNAYFLPAVRIRGRVCRTHVHPHTAFRGFGGPKGVATIERIIEEVAHALGVDPLDVRRRNVYTDAGGRNVTPYGQTLQNNLLPDLFERLEKDSEYRKRRESVASENRRALEGGGHLLRGLSLTPIKFGISFTTRFLNQGNALVVVHRDGSLQVSTGATEMGQGVNARIRKVVAEELGLDESRVRLMPTATDKNANTSPTAASSGTDLNASAAVMAARKIKVSAVGLGEAAARLAGGPLGEGDRALGTESELVVPQAPMQGDNPNEGTDPATGVASYHGLTFDGGRVFSRSRPEKYVSFEDLTNEAYLNRISLSDYAHYRVPNLTFNKLSGQGKAFLYFTQGVGLSEVTVDLWTGEVKAAAADLLMDLGRPILEGLDVGQVWGGFVQGTGWVTMEKLHYSPEGALLSHSPSTYKIPSVQDIPREFRVRLLANPGNTVNLRGTKAVGEPPLMLAIGVWTAIQNALTYLPHYEDTYPRSELPATQEQVLRALDPDSFLESGR